MSSAPSRRAVLRAAGLAAGGAALQLASACSGTPRTSATHGPGQTATTTGGTRRPPVTSGTPTSTRTSGTPTSATAATSTASTATSGTPTATSQGWPGLAKRLEGPVLRPGTSGFRSVAHGYNPRYDGRSPAAVARCANAGDVRAAVEWAIGSGSEFSVRSGGHSYTGWSTSPGLVIDVSELAAVSVDRGARTARIGAGARLIDVYHGLAGQGLGVPAGSCPSVGMAGLTLGGGIGVLSRAWGLTCDSVTAARIVLADGTAHDVDADHEPDLYWALRGGGGGSFGAVTSFDVTLRPAPTVQTFYLAFPYAAAAEVLDAWQRWAPHADRRLWSACHLAAATDSGRRSISVAGTWLGSSSSLGTVLDSLVRRAGASPTYRSGRPHSYESAMLLEAGCKEFKSCHLAPRGSLGREPMSATSSMLPKPLDGKGIAAVLDQIDAGLEVSTAGATGVAFDSLGGAVDDVSATGTAYGHRGALASMQYTATWSEKDALKDPRPMDAYVRGFRRAMTPWCGEAAYVNYQDAAIKDYGRAYWGKNYRQLQQVKRRVDPDDRFTFPQAVRA